MRVVLFSESKEIQIKVEKLRINQRLENGACTKSEKNSKTLKKLFLYCIIDFNLQNVQMPHNLLHKNIEKYKEKNKIYKSTKVKIGDK